METFEFVAFSAFLASCNTGTTEPVLNLWQMKAFRRKVMINWLKMGGGWLRCGLTLDLADWPQAWGRISVYWSDSQLPPTTHGGDETCSAAEKRAEERLIGSHIPKIWHLSFLQSGQNETGQNAKGHWQYGIRSQYELSYYGFNTLTSELRF